MKTYTKEEIRTIAENALHHACSYMQDEIGVKTGDYAGLYFTSEIGDEIHAIFEKYIRQEISFREVME
jgi:hypothetical protein